MQEIFLSRQDAISICVNRKLFRMKLTTTQETIQTLKRTVFLIYIFRS